MPLGEQVSFGETDFRTPFVLVKDAEPMMEAPDARTEWLEHDQSLE